MQNINLDQTPNSNQGTTPPSPPPSQIGIPPQTMPPQSGGSGGTTGPIIGIIIIVAVLVIGGLYFWGSKLSKETQDSMTPEEIVAEEDAARTALETQSTSDTVESIEEDLNITDLEGLDAELGDIETEFGL